MVHNPGGDWHPGRGDNPIYAQNYVALIPLNLSGLPNVFLVVLEVEKQQNVPLNHEKHRVRFYIVHPTSTF